jgi:hypothetical protein
LSTPDEIKKAELRGYSKGYAAGKKKLATNRSLEHERRERQALYDRAMIAALPFAMEQNNWNRGKEQIRTLQSRVALASEIAEEALKQRKRVK